MIPAPLPRAELYRLTKLCETLRPRPWTPAMVIGGLHPSEVSFVCQSREVVPALAWQALRLGREVSELRAECDRLARELAARELVPA